MSSVPINHAVSGLTFQDLPVETLIEILQNLDISSVASVSKVSKRLKKIIETNWAVTLRPIINRDMTPIGPFLQVLSVCDSKVAPPAAKFCFAASDDDMPSSGELSASDDDDSTSGGDEDDEVDSSAEDDETDVETDVETDSDDDSPGNIDDALAIKINSPGPEDNGFASGVLPDQWAEGLSYNSVMRVCRFVKAWELEFHRLRFAYPHHRRTLEQHELFRLRHAIYVWWRYSCHFHDGACLVDGEDGNVDSPIARMDFVRQFSTSQLHELRDMWETIKSAVGREICPSVSAVRRQSGHVLSWAEAARVGWGEPAENGQVVRTIMKLRPEDILHLLVNRHRFATKASVIQFVRFRNPWIEDSVETFSDSIQWALWERERQLVAEYGPRALHRRWYFPPLGFYPRPWGGIVDYKKAETEQLRNVYSRDTGAGTHYWIDDHGGPRRYLARQVPTGRLVVSRGW
ncbi:hypothetical protein QBC34DRAFT_70101 [Podospora aff. communis PSN243]|uniref:F-box domain-containing protein n=1 Tax=Podospora aff. communis PSN243 TaxID=3040156 RepID=A0AAV9H6M4_9PEZI|nr:hypothetical protein QBC34DRAFT_70101 [Podospora aff. communis PSN243]